MKALKKSCGKSGNQFSHILSVVLENLVNMEGLRE